MQQFEQAPKPIFGKIEAMEKSATVKFLHAVKNVGLDAIANRIASEQDPAPVRSALDHIIASAGVVFTEIKDHLAAFKNSLLKNESLG